MGLLTQHIFPASFCIKTIYAMKRWILGNKAPPALSPTMHVFSTKDNFYTLMCLWKGRIRCVF